MFDPVIEDNINFNPTYPPQMIPLRIDNSILATYLKSSGCDKKPTAIILHGFPGNETNLDIAHTLSRGGFNSIIFHYRGTWGSGGKFSFSNAIEDVRTIYKYLIDNSGELEVDAENISIIGHSMGAFLGMMNLPELEKIRKIAFLAGFNFGAFAKFIQANPNLKGAAMEHLSTSCKMIENSNPQELFDEIMENSSGWDLIEKIKKIEGRGMLFIGARYDQVAPQEMHIKPLFELSKIKNKSVYKEIISGHVFGSRRIELNRIIWEWIKK